MISSSMFSLKKLYFSLVRIPIKWLVRIKVLPESPTDDLSIDTGKPIYYVLRTRSASSFTMLMQQCELLGLPRPQYIHSNATEIPNGGVFFVQKKSFWGTPPTTLKKYHQKLQLLLEQHFENSQDTQLIPVSIYWGRNPGKEKSLFRLMLTDTESANRFRKLLILLFQGRNSFMMFGAPLQLNLIKQQSNIDATTRKVLRILRVYFHRQWSAAMGPLVAHRKQLITSILAQDEVISAIKREQSKKNISSEKARQLALKYADEIAANYSYTTVRMANNLLTWLWNKMYAGITVSNSERLRGLASQYELVYMPCHRSHIDYLLLSYVLYQEGLVPPHIAAGINLNFWPVGGLLRTGGAFFLRRSFSGNKLYSAVFNAYLYLLLDRGYPVEFFPEGGRSRTGRLLQPKTGMLSMTVQSALKGIKKPIMLVPVYVGYERMMEGKNYVKEMHGGKKKKESMGQLLKVRNQLKQRYGRVYLSFAEPISLEQKLNEVAPDWRNEGHTEKPPWLSKFVSQISETGMESINKNAAINSVNLVSLILLSTQRHTLGRQELLAQITLYLSLLSNKELYPEIRVPDTDALNLLDDAKALSAVFEFDNPLGNLCQITEKSAILLTYYRNNIIHLFAVPALIASCFRHAHSLPVEDIFHACRSVYPLLKRELFLHYQEEELNEVITSFIDIFIEQGLIIRTGELLQRPEIISDQYSELMLLADTLKETLERYGITLTLLSTHAGKAAISRSQLESQSQKLAQRISALYNIYAPEAFDKVLFQQIVSSLRRNGFIENKDNGELLINEDVHKLQLLVMRLLGQTTQESLSKTARWAVERWSEE